MRYILMILLLSGFHVAPAQLQGDQWVMGYSNSGEADPKFNIFSVDFREEHPVYHIYPNIHHSIFGTSANICVPDGEPLLHTNGMEILWMEDDNSMDSIAQGEYWNFNAVSDQALGYRWQEGATILVDPGDENLYHIFYHNAQWHPTGNTYIHDRILTAKVKVIGDTTTIVVAKDQIIAPPDRWYSSAIVPLRHANGRDWWVNVFEYDSAHYRSYLLDPSGVRLEYEGSLDIAVESGLGQSAFSWNGNYFVRVDANIIGDPQIVTICRYDRCAGELERIATLAMASELWSGIAVSPDERYVYASNRYSIRQWDLWAPDIAASMQELDWSTTRYFGPMITAPDGRIYCIPGWGNSRSAFVIDQPYLPAEEQDGTRQLLFPRENARSLPNNPNYRLGPIDGSPCDTLGIDNSPVARWRWSTPNLQDKQNIYFVDLSYYEPETWLWEFGDGNTSDSVYPEHRYDAPGLYHVCLTVSNENATDSTCKWIEVDMSTALETPESNKPDFTVSPNPFTDQIRISLGDDTQLAWHRLRIADIHGRIVMDQEVPVPSVIHLKHLPPGVYASVLYDENGSVIDSELAMKAE